MGISGAEDKHVYKPAIPLHFKSILIFIKLISLHKIDTFVDRLACLTAPQRRIYPVITSPPKNNNSNLFRCITI